MASADSVRISIPRKSFIAIVLLSIGLAIGGPIVWADHVAAPPLIWAGPCLLIAAAWLIARAANGPRLALYGVVLLTAIDLGLYGLSYAVYREVCPLEDFVAAIDCPAGTDDHRVALDLASDTRPGIRTGNQILLRGYSRIDGYAGLEPARSLDYRKTSALRAAGVGWIADRAAVELRSDFVDNGNSWLRLRDPLPRTRLVRNFHATDWPDRDLDTIDLESTALVSPADCDTVAAHFVSRPTGLNANTRKPATTDSIRIVTDRPGRILIEVASASPQLLVLTESYHAGWTANIDGRPVRTLRVNGDFLGCLVHECAGDVEFRFAPRSLQIGRAGSLFGLGFWVLLFTATWLPRFRHRRA